MSSMVFKFLSNERIEVLQALIYYHTGKQQGLTIDQEPTVVGWDEYMGECSWSDFLAWDKSKFCSPEYQWFEWYTYDAASSKEFAESFRCMCKMKNLFVVAGQAHSVTYLFVEVGSPMIGDEDRTYFFKEYVPDSDDLRIQDAIRFAVEEVKPLSDAHESKPIDAGLTAELAKHLNDDLLSLVISLGTVFMLIFGSIIFFIENALSISGMLFVFALVFAYLSRGVYRKYRQKRESRIY